MQNKGITLSHIFTLYDSEIHDIVTFQLNTSVTDNSEVGCLASHVLEKWCQLVTLKGSSQRSLVVVVVVVVVVIVVYIQRLEIRTKQIPNHQEEYLGRL